MPDHRDDIMGKCHIITPGGWALLELTDVLFHSQALN